QALAWYREVVEAMGGQEEAESFAAGFGQEQSGNNPFFLGQSAMLLSGEWFPYWIERYAPATDYGVAAFPTTDPAAPPTCAIGGNVVCIPTDSRHPSAAWEFIAWLQTRGAERELARGIFNMPYCRDMLCDAAL